MPKSFIFYFGFLGLTNNGIISNRLYYTVGDMLMAKELNTITTSKEYVAFELAQNISRQEDGWDKPEEEFRKYYLDLYAECLKATGGIPGR